MFESQADLRLVLALFLNPVSVDTRCTRISGPGKASKKTLHAFPGHQITLNAFSVFSEPFPGHEMRVHLMSTGTGLKKRANTNRRSARDSNI
jgi:hypothetical protein